MNHDAVHSPPKPRALVTGLCCAITLLAASLFRTAREFDLLNWDDQLHLSANPFIQPDSPQRFAHFWREPYGKLYIPIAYNAWAIVYGMSFDEAGVFSPAKLHLLNVMTHAINAGLTFLLIVRLLRSTRTRAIIGAAIGATIFAIHPLQAESVAWIAEFRGLSSAMFALVAWLAHLRAMDSLKRSHAIPLEAFATLCFAAALLCKPSVAAVPMMVAVADYLLERRTFSQIASRLGSWFALAGACLIATKFLQVSEHPAESVLARPLVAIDALVFYLGKLVWPFALSADHSRTPAIVLRDVSIWWTWIIPAWIAGLLIWKPNRIVIAASLLFLSALLPVLGLIPFEFQFISTVADRYAYLALLGPALLVGYALAANPRWMAMGLFLCVLLGWRTMDQLRHWRSDNAVWSHAAAVNPHAIVANANLADAAANRGDHTTAKRLFDRVIELDPHRVNGYLGNARLREDAGDWQGALEWYDRARTADPTSHEPFELAGTILLREGQVDEAIAQFQSALRLEPDAIYVLNNLGAAFLRQGRPDEAMQLFDRVLELDPRHMHAHVNRAIILRERGDIQGFVDALNRARRFAGTDPTPLDMLGKFAMTLNDWPAARDCFERSLALSPGRVDIMTDLATTLARLGEYDQAITLLEEARTLAPGSPVLSHNIESVNTLKRRASTTTPDGKQ